MDKFTKLIKSNPLLRYDPFVKQMVRREEHQREQNAMHTMSQLPNRSGWILLLQNRVNLHSIGNQQSARKVWYNANNRMVGDSREECNIPFRNARLKNHQPAAGWIEL